MDINKEIEKLIEKINKKIKPVSILALEILTPEDVHLNRIKFHIRIASCVDKGKYDQAIREFVYGCDTKNNAPIRSLYYSRYKECIKYHERTETSPVDKTHTYTELKRDTIVIDSSVAAEFGSSASIESYWNAWCTTIEKHLSSAISTMWTYVTINSVQEESHKQHISSGYLIFDGKLDSDNRILVNKYVQDFLVSYTTLLFSQSLILAATRAAISQVMARNSSHNIGSHVLNKLTGDLNQIDFSVKNYRSVFESKTIEKDNLLDQISKFNNYIKCRMDYLADITLGIPAMQISKKLKSEVLNEIDDVRLLLENISGLSDFPYSIKIECDFDNDPAIAMPNDILGCQAFYNIVENVIRNTAKHSDKKNIDDPVNATGEKKVVHFTICIKKIVDDGLSEELLKQSEVLYEVNIYDNIIVEEDAKLEEHDKADYCKKTNVSNDTHISKIDYLVFSQNEKLNESILRKEDNTLRSTGLGLIEMEASACYLRKLDISNLEDDDYQIEYDENIYNKKDNLNILKAIKVKAQTQTDGNPENYYLGYRFFVLKPTEVLLVGNYELSDELKNNGFLQLSYEAFEKDIEAGKVFNHQFLVYEEDKTICLINHPVNVKGTKDEELYVYKYKAVLPKRIIKIEPNKMSLDANPEKVLQFVWAEWALNSKINDVEISTGVPSCCDSKDIHILNHGPSHIEDETQKSDFNKWHGAECNKNTNYIEALSSKGQQKLPSFEKLSKPTKGNTGKPLEVYLRNIMEYSDDKYTYPDLFYSVVESAIAKIVIIDERVQYASENNIDEKFPFSKHYKHCNIFVPDKKIDLGANDLINVKEQVKDFLTPFLNMENYIVIHYSIIERFFNNSQNKEVDVHKWLNDLSNLTNVIVTSGRGTLKKLPRNIHFINLSPLLASVIDFRSKFYLHQIIMSSRKAN
ncbi:MAG: hypothetical protein QY315_05005 [Saprospiraceae bacterium]|jgi:hypothetical protein|nr:MAG: hypothetical protein QY315_05005 [Saprospiraceae bacterium]